MDNDTETDSLDDNAKIKRAKLGYEAFSKKLRYSTLTKIQINFNFNIYLLTKKNFKKINRVYKFQTLNELKIKLYEKITEYKKEYGVLCFLYSLLLTKVKN